MTPTDLYRAAIANREQTGERYGAASVTVATGETVYCSIKPVAGCSIVNKHDRISWHIKQPGEQYSKNASRKRAAELLHP